MSTISSFKITKSKHDIYRGEDCMKKFYQSLREDAIEITNLKKEKNEVTNKRTA